MKQMCKQFFPPPRSCRNELSNPRCFTVSVNSTEPRLQTTVRQLGLASSIRHERGLWTLHNTLERYHLDRPGQVIVQN